MTRVSIITTAYNATDDQYYTSFASLNNQTSKDFEWIIVDDGSKDNGLVYFPDVRLERNYGPSVARNIGFQISSGDIITYLDMGDELNPERVENLIKLFSTHKVDLVFSAYNIVQDGQPLRFDHFDYIGRHPEFPTAFEYLQLLEKQNISIPMGVAHTRYPFVLEGGFQRGIVCGEDGILWRRMLKDIPRDRILFSDDVAGSYYISPDGQSRTQRRFEMGGFAFDGTKNDNGKYLDQEWYAHYWSEGLYD